jgi:single-strand DNA-binding protein
MSINRVFLLGNVGNDPEVRESNGGKFATFRLATTDRAYTTKAGVQVPERTEWHSIIASGNIVTTIERYVRKGTKLYIEGKLRTRKYTARDNTERTVTEIYLDQMELLGSKPQTESNPNVPFANQQRSQQNPHNWSGSDNVLF